MKSLSQENNVIKIDGRSLTDLRFADDTVLFTDNIYDVKKIFEEIVCAYSQVGLRINASKSQVRTSLMLAEHIRLDN